MKYLTLDYWMNKLGYRRTHWSDEMKEELWTMFETTVKYEPYITEDFVGGVLIKMTLSVKKKKK